MAKNNQLLHAAIHEAGHALMHYLIDGNLNKIKSIEIYTGKYTGEGFCRTTEDSLLPPSFYDNEIFWFNLFCIHLAGVYAEAKFFQEEINQGILSYELDIFGNTPKAYKICHLLEKNNLNITNYQYTLNKAESFVDKAFSDAKNLSIIHDIANLILNKKENHYAKIIYPLETMGIINKYYNEQIHRV